MPTTNPAALRRTIAEGTVDPVYLIVGDDIGGMAHLTEDLAGLVEDELRAFNVERIYATDKPMAASIVESARLLPMMSKRRVVIVQRAEKILKPKRRGAARSEDDVQDDDGGGAAGADAAILEDYVRNPHPETVLVFVASDVDRTRRLYKTLQKNATIVECWGLKAGKDAKVDLRQAAKLAEQLVREEVSDAGQQIDSDAVRLVAARAGTDINSLRGDVQRLLLYATGKPRITVADAREVVSAESSQDDWAVTNAIERGDTARALRELGLALDAGGVSYKILGQLAYFVRERLDPRRVPAAVEALFRTDLDLKNSVGDARVLLERLIVELCVPGVSSPQMLDELTTGSRRL
jgi:DNA polymerase III subunit delta